VNYPGIFSATDITYPPYPGAPSPRRGIQISPALRRAVVGLFIWGIACLILSGGTFLHHNAAVTQADSGLCKR
jgi:hypothetical protein